MLNWFDIPGRLYVAATLLPLAAFVVLLVAGGVRAACRPYRRRGGFVGNLYWVCGGDKPIRTGANLATACMAAAAALALVGLVKFLNDPAQGAELSARWSERTDWIRLGPLDTGPPQEWLEKREKDPGLPTPPLALALEVGYKIDHLTAVIFAMVTVVGTLIFVFSLGYMKDETNETVADHEVDRQRTPPPNPLPHGERGDEHSPPSLVGKGDGGLGHSSHFHRRGRFGRFFLYLSLFCFSMLNLVIADNLFQVFVSWELVGVCSFFLIGFYYERPSASTAANKAFIVNRIGDAGFLVGIAVAWVYCGTLNIEELIQRVRVPEREARKVEGAAQVIRVKPGETLERKEKVPGAAGEVSVKYTLLTKESAGTHVLLFPLTEPPPERNQPLPPGTFAARASGDYATYGAIPYWLFIVMGIGIFFGCVGKSAQVPLHTWLPDAMEGPTPVSALIHAATMVAAGVYLVGRCFPLFAPEVLLFIAYTGAITLFISATIALVQTDIKRILAYSTCSQLGFMMLALGVGGWVAGFLHLITHAFFKALLFLCSGSVIFGCHHEQDVRKMGGLWRKMPVTAFTMLVGVLAISGAPFLSGWYSKDQIIGAALGYGLDHKQHIMLLVLPLVTTAMTAFYMFRLWFLTFAGKPRDQHMYDHAHESPSVMTVPLVILAAFSIGVAWGWPVWDADASYLGQVLKASQPAAVEVGFAQEHHTAHEYHLLAGVLALALAVAGAALAWWFFGRHQPTTEALYATGTPGYRFLLNKWYFDEAYDAAVVNPTVALAKGAAAADKRPTDGQPPPGEPELPAKKFDWWTLDGFLNGIAQAFVVAGARLRAVQSGRLRSYILALGLTAAVLLGILTALAK
jgi:NADH-quinone oxidoreductase subunit L